MDPRYHSSSHSDASASPGRKPSPSPTMSPSSETTDNKQQQQNMMNPGKGRMKDPSSSFEALFDSGYSTGLPSAHTSSSNIDFSSQSSIITSSSSNVNVDPLRDAKRKEEEIEVPTSDSGLCLDSSSSLFFKEDSSSFLPTSNPSSPSRTLPRLDLDNIGPEALLPNEEGYSLLHLSILKGCIDISLCLIQKALHPDQLDVRNGNGQVRVSFF